MAPRPPILVAGAGIAGLTAAIALARRGFPVTILERSPMLTEAGAGIQLPPNAGRILTDLGLDAAIAGAASTPAAVDVAGGRSGKIIASIPLGPHIEARHGHPYRTIHRADLQAVLAAAIAAEPAIEMRLGHTLVAHATHARGATVMAETSDGAHVEFAGAALVGADGAGSTIRSSLAGSPRVPTGRVAWRAVLPVAALPRSIPRDRIGLWLGPDAHVVHYPVRGGAEFNIVAIVPGQRDAPEAGVVDLIRRFDRWALPVVELMSAAPAWHRWPISVVDPGGRWRDGAAILIGDAAHAMPPYLAQGGAMAIEDSAVLAAEVAARPDDIPAAFAAFETGRRERVRQVWRAATRTARIYHLGAPAAAVRNLGMRLLGGAGVGALQDWLYGWRV